MDSVERTERRRFVIGNNPEVRVLVGLILAILAVAFGLIFLDVFTTKLVSGEPFAYVGMAAYGTAAYAATRGAVRYLRPARITR
jgi:hypothetical protein